MSSQPVNDGLIDGRNILLSGMELMEETIIGEILSANRDAVLIF